MSLLPFSKRQWHIHCVHCRAGVPAHSREGLGSDTFPAVQNGSCAVLTHQVLGNAGIFTCSEMPAWAACGTGHPAPGFVGFQPVLSLWQDLIWFAKVPAKLSDSVQPADKTWFISSQRNALFCLSQNSALICVAFKDPLSHVCRIERNQCCVRQRARSRCQ